MTGIPESDRCSDFLVQAAWAQYMFVQTGGPSHLLHREVWARDLPESTWIAIGMVDRRDQQKTHDL